MVPFRVALTFDAEHPDRPTEPDAEVRLLDGLERLAVPATFFLQGRWVETYPQRARRIADAGHLVGSHGHYHVRMPLLNDTGLATDIADAEAVIVAATGVDPRPWFRCPFGAGGDDPRVTGSIAAAGYRHVPWDIVVEDWEPAMSGQAIADAVVNAALSRRDAGDGDGSIVLLHSWPAGTADAIDGLATGLRGAGAELVRVDALPRWSLV